MEAVNLLRSCITRKRLVSMEGDMLAMTDETGAKVAYPLKSPTPIVDPRKTQQYTLGAIWLVHKMHGQGMGALMKEAMKLQLVGKGFQLPTIAQQPAILSYLKGEPAAAGIIDAEKEAQLGPTVSASKVVLVPGKAPAAAASGAGAGGKSAVTQASSSSSGAAGPFSTAGLGLLPSVDTSATSSTGAAAAGASGSASASSAAAAGSQWSYEDPDCLALLARANEQIWLSRNTILDAPNPRGTYLRDFVFAQFHHKEEETQRAMAKASAAATKQAADQAKAAGLTAQASALQEQLRGRFSNSRATAAAVAATRQDRGPRGTPIIVVPAAPTSLISMYNAKQLLENGVFVSPEEAKAAHGSRPRPAKHEIYRTDARTGQRRKYYVVDSVSQFRSSDWGKVVAVFAHGPDWQFKGWRWGRKADRPDVTPAEVFDRVAGFHLYYGGTDTPNCVRRWALTALPIQRSMRHSDSQQVGRFWADVERFIHVKRPSLAREAEAAGGSKVPAGIGAKRGRVAKGRAAGRSAAAGGGGGQASAKRART